MAMVYLLAWLLVVYVVDQVVLRGVVRHAERLVFQRGDWRRADRFLARFGVFMPRRTRAYLELAVAEWSGDTERAVAMVESRVAPLAHANFVLANECVTTLVNAGRYRRALEIGARGSEDPPARLLPFWALLQINLAEAEYNLGLWAEALLRLDRTRRVCDLEGIARAGERQQRAWILVHLGRIAEAHAAALEADARDLPRVFHAEHRFTHARIALAEKDLSAALAHVNDGLRLARRIASTRNGLFLRARIRAAAGQSADALADYELAASLKYRGQGGDGLLAWGDLLRSLGREDEARRAFTLAIERDGESESARHAADRLSAVA